MAGEAKAALERIVGLIDTLDGNSQTQEALSEAVAQEEAIGEVWVTNGQGIIVYYGRYRPPIRNVADIPLGTLTELLDTVFPKSLLSAHTADRDPVACDNRGLLGSTQAFHFLSNRRYSPKAPNHFFNGTLSLYGNHTPYSRGNGLCQRRLDSRGRFATIVHTVYGPSYGETQKDQTSTQHNRRHGYARQLDPLLALHPCVDGFGRKKER